MSNYISKDEKEKQAEKQKTKLTKEIIYNNLLLSHKVNFFGWLAVSVLALIVGIALIIGFSIGSPFNEKWTRISKILFVLIPLIIAIVDIIVYFYNKKRLDISDYKIVTDRVERVSEYDKKVGGKYRYEHAIYLWHTGRFVMVQRELKYISKGDVYYVVVSNKHPDKAIMLFDAKKCELDEMNEETVIEEITVDKV